MQKESGGLVLLQTIISHSDAGFDGNRALYARETYDKVATQLAFEYGVADWLTLLAAPEWVSIRTGLAPGTPGPAYSGFGYSEIGARVRFAQGDGWILSGQSVLRIAGVPPSTPNAPIGYRDGELDMRMMLGVSFAIFGFPAFLDLELGERLREGAPPDEIRLDTTLGLRITEHWQALVQAFGVMSQGAGRGPDFPVSYEYLKGQAGVMYDLTSDLSFMFTGFSTLHARNAIQENGLTAAALLRF